MADEHNPIDPAPNVRDTRMQARAIRGGWPIPDGVRFQVVKRLVGIVDEDAVHPEGPPSKSDVIAAVRALIAADTLNVAERRLELEREKLDLAREKMERESPGDAPTEIVVRRVARHIDGKPGGAPPGAGADSGGGAAV